MAVAEVVVEEVLAVEGPMGGVHQRSWVVGRALVDAVVVELLAMRGTFFFAAFASVVVSLALVAFASVLALSPARRSSVFAEVIVLVALRALRRCHLL